MIDKYIHPPARGNPRTRKNEPLTITRFPGTITFWITTMDINNALPDKAFLKTSEVATLLGVNPSSVFSWVKKGVLRPVRTPGGTFRFARSDIQKFIGEYQQVPVDRRRDPRFRVHYPAKIRIEKDGNIYTFEATLRDISATGMGLVVRSTGDLSNLVSAIHQKGVVIENMPASPLRDVVPVEIRYMRKLNPSEAALGLLLMLDSKSPLRLPERPFLPKASQQ
jgi:excisionase family DNA binding protein